MNKKQATKLANSHVSKVFKFNGGYTFSQFDYDMNIWRDNLTWSYHQAIYHRKETKNNLIQKYMEELL